MAARLKVEEMRLTVFVSHFEDITMSNGEVITMYQVNVQYSTTLYVLAKRYSDFQEMYASG